MQNRYWENFDRSLAQIMREIPRMFFIKSRWKATRSIFKTLSLLLLCWGLTWLLGSSDLATILKWALGIPLALVTGTVLTGGFDIAHDAAHRSLFNSRATNNVWGIIFSSLVGWPFHLWRRAHDIHHKFTNNARHDIAWEPKSQEQIAKWSPILVAMYKVRGSRTLFWIGGFLHLVEQVLRFLGKNKRFQEDRGEIWVSLIAALAVSGTYAYAAYTLLGLFGLVIGCLLPWTVYYWWLTTFTLLHHTSPDTTFIADGDWQKNVGAAQLMGTINVRYGAVIDFLTHNIAWHIPHHVTVGIPHYHLKDATEFLLLRYPVREVKFSFGYLWKTIDQCHAVASREDLTWRSFEELGI